MSLFPSSEEFDRCVAANKKMAHAIHWNDLATNVIYRVKSKEKVETESGENTLLQLVNRENEEFKVRAPPSVLIALCEPYPKKKIPYIRSLGTQCKRKVFETVFLQDRQTSKKMKDGKRLTAKSELRNRSRIPKISEHKKKTQTQCDALEDIQNLIDAT